MAPSACMHCGGMHEGVAVQESVCMHAFVPHDLLWKDQSSLGGPYNDVCMT